jgi:cell division protein FtsB
MPIEPPVERQRVRTLTERSAHKGHGTVFYVLVFVTAVLVLNAVFGDKGVLAMMRAHREYAQLSAEVEQAREQNAQLSDQVRRLRDDPATIEDLARRQLGLIRAGEKVFIISDIPPPPVVLAPTTPQK